MADESNTNILQNKPVSLQDEMRSSYLDYAMSVIIGRAIPDARDGLKPVQRRILYAMLREGLLHNRPFDKCAGVVGEVLKNYHGTLISDFYGGYDAMPCAQQKCLVHLIRDLNDDLWTAPFDTELESFVLHVKNLLEPIFEAVARYGLKQRHLQKFQKSVATFYQRHIEDKDYKSEAVQKFQKRFQRYRNSLFTFLDHDGIPWNNNMAERALRHLAVQRKISGAFFEEAARRYLVLLGIAQTCRFQGKSLLRFLMSEEKDIDRFRAAPRPTSQQR